MLYSEEIIGKSQNQGKDTKSSVQSFLEKLNLGNICHKLRKNRY